jgi:hypothetical protein
MSTLVPATVGELLRDVPDGLEHHPAVRRQLDQITGLTAAAARILTSQIADSLAQLLDLDLTQIVLDGWSKHRELLAAARKTARSPGRTEEVELADHRISSRHQPAIEVYLNGSRVATVQFELEVWIDLQSVIALVRGGRLVEIRAGDTGVGARLATAGHNIAERRIRCSAGALIRLGSGVALLEGTAAPKGRAGRSSTGSGRSRLPARALVFAAVVLLTLAGAGFSAAVQDQDQDQDPEPPAINGSIRPGSGWHMRTGPISTAESVGTLAPGTAVRVGCTDSNWVRLIEPRDGVYVYRDGLELASPPPSCG